jgi:predicted dehydrogenase
MSSIPKVSDRLKVGIIGLGGIANTHVLGWQTSPHTEVVAGSDIRPEVFDTWKQKYGVTRFYEDFKDLLADPDVDIIDICSPNMFHTEQAIAALNAGKHVICEKPLAPAPADIRKMIDARNKAGKLLMTAQHFRFRGVSQSAKAEIDTGVLGDVYHARAWMLRRCLLPNGATFVHKSRSGGGPTIDIGVHILDLTLWLMGHPKPVAVSGVAKAALAHHEGAFTMWGRSRVMEGVDVEDFAAAFVRFENGATLILEVSWLLHHNTPGEEAKVWLYGSEGGLEWPSDILLTSNYTTKQLLTATLGATSDTMEPHALECVEFAKAVAEGLPSPVPAEQSLMVQSILDGIYRSQAEGKEVSI